MRSQPHKAREKALSEVGERISDALAPHTKAWLVRESGVSRTVIDDAMTGTFPSVDKALKIAQALGMSVEFMMTGQDRPLLRLPGSSVAEGAQKALLALADRAGPGYTAEPSSTRPQPDQMSAYDRAALILDRAVSLAKWEPTEPVRIALMQILFRFPVDAESIALLLQAVAPEVGD